MENFSLFASTKMSVVCCELSVVDWIRLVNLPVILLPRTKDN